MTSRTIFPVVVSAFLLLGFVVPMVRMRMRTGRSGLVVSNAADAFQPVVKTALATLVAGALVLAVLHAAFGPESIGVWAAPSWLLIGGLVLAALGTAVMIVAQAQMRDSWRIGIDTEP